MKTTKFLSTFVAAVLMLLLMTACGKNKTDTAISSGSTVDMRKLYIYTR